MLVLGGTYGERCSEPERHEIAGSGLRAAAALADLDPGIRLITAVNDDAGAHGALSEQAAAEFVVNHYGIRHDFRTRTKPVSWSYFTPLSAPTLNGSGAALAAPLEADGDNALVFGLIEASAPESAPVKVRARRVALDPQKPRDLSLADVADIEADDVLLILNEDETRALGGSTHIATAAKNLLTFKDWHIAAVITKRGPRGALVTLPGADEPHVVSPLWTPRVYPIGSGDVFAAATAWAWAEQEHDPVDAARIGSAAAAYWCDRESLPLPADALTGSGYRPVAVHPGMVYLAGPFFNLAQRWLVDLVEHKLRPYRFSPLHDVGRGGVDVAQKDIDGLDHSRSVLALLDGSDPGTIFEAGYATSRRTPLVCFAESIDHEGYKMLAGTGAEITSDLSTAVYHAMWAAMDPHAWLNQFS